MNNDDAVRLVRLYRRGSEREREDAFNALYQGHKGAMLKVASNWQRPGMPFEDLLELMSIEFWKAIKDFDDKLGKKFIGFVMMRLNSRAKQEAEKYDKRRSREVLPPPPPPTDESNEEFANELIPDLSTDNDVERTVLNKIGRQQLQLCLPRKSAKTIAVVKAIMNDRLPKYSLTEIGKEAGKIDHKVVKDHLDFIKSKLEGDPDLTNLLLPV